MATVAALPNTLREKIAAVAAKMARLRLLRRGAVSVLALAAMLGLILLADHWLKFGTIIRFILLSGWGALAVAGVVACAKSLSRQADVDALAALIESEYPNLAERLTSSVELAEASDGGHGSPALINLLIRETEIRASKLDFLRAAPERGTFRVSLIAGAVLAVVLLPSAIWPSAYFGEVKRVFLPWVKAPLGYEVVANPGDIAVARGHGVTLSAFVRATGSAESLPRQATLVMTDAGGRPIRLGMKSDQPHVFFCKINAVAEGFRYRVEAGDAVGDEHRVIAVDPVQLASDSPSITIAPPEYARKVVETKTIAGLGDFAALQHSQQAFAFTFTRPARAATLEWLPANGASAEGAKPIRYALPLGPDGTTAKFNLPALQGGRLTLTLEAEHGIRTDLPPQALTVTVDRPPIFLKVGGTTEQMRTVNAHETIPLELSLADDFGVESAVLEFRINDGDIQTETIKLDGAGTPLANAKYALKLTGRVKEGDTFQYRLKITDNRRVPEAKLEPHVVYHPADQRWFSFKVTRNAEPLKQQEILAQRDDVRKRIDDLVEKLRAERRSVLSTQLVAKRNDKLLPEPAFKLQELRKEHQNNEQVLNDLAKDVALTPALTPLANRLQEVAEQEMRNAATDMQKAEKEKTAAAPRDRELEKADRELESALKRLDDLRQENEKLAQQRTDEMKLQQLAEREQQLAEKAGQEKDPQKAQDLAREQAEIARELQRLTEQSPELRNALNQAQAEANQQLADKARELAQAQRDLAQATNQTDRDAKTRQLADLAKQQKELADKAANLAEQTRQPATAAQTRPLDPEKPKQAAAALAKGDANQALTKQEQTAQDLDKLAGDLDRAVQLARDPREAAKQLARLQDDLKNRTNSEARQTPLDRMPAEKLNDLRRDQQAIQQAAERLSVPPTNVPAQQEKKQAAEHAANAADQLKKKNQSAAEAEMTQAKQALERLADKLPSVDQRLAEAREQVTKLKQQQSDIARQAEQTARQAEPNPADAEKARRELAQKLADAARKQADAADKLAKLDAPNHEARQERTQDAMNKALQDLLSARPQDIPASQQQAKRELERLEQALNGVTPADERAAQLARQQEQVAKDAAKLATDPSNSVDDKARQMLTLQNQQRELARDTANLQAQDAPQRHAEATQATKQAERTSRDPSKPADLAKKADEAAQALRKLADQMSGQESDAAKADRLAKRQAELANEAERLANKPEPAAQADARRKQQQIQDEAKQIRGGDEAAREKQKATEALARLSRASPEDIPEAQRQAADALKDLSDRLAGKQANADPMAKPQQVNQPPTAEQLAREQRQLAQQTQQARDKAANQPLSGAQQATQQLAKQQAQLNRQAGQVPANNQPKALEQARQAMNQAEQALAKGDWQNAQQKQQDAAKALEQMAQQQSRPTANRPNGQQPQTNSQASNLPNKGQVEQARQLAQQQRDLRDAVQKAVNDLAKQNAQPQNNPVGDLAKEQQAIAQQAQQLAQQATQQQGQKSESAQQAQQAAKAAQQASNQMQAGALPQAKQSGQQAAQQLQQMAQNNKGEPAQQAQQLGQRQEAVNRQLEQLANNSQAQAAQQAARQQNLTQQAQQLGQQMQQQASQTVSPDARTAMQQAAQATQQGQQSMQQAQNAQRQGNASQTQQSQQQAAQNLDRAAQLAQQAAQAQGAESGQSQPGSPQQQAGQALQQAQNQMGQAQQQLKQQQAQQAQGSMQQATQSLQQAAQSMQQGQPSQPPKDTTTSGGNDGSAAGAIDLAKYGPDAKKYQGKPWGELPGELRTRIIQDLKAQFGDDYSRMIKLYFEQLADKK